MAESHSITGRTLTLTLPCDLARVRGVAMEARAFLVEQGCREEDVIDCELALVEACNNAIEYAPEPARALPVCVELTCETVSIEMRVRDHTNGFDWPPALSLPSSDAERGRGLFLIRSVMTQADYIQGGDGNVMLLKRQRLG